MDMMGVGANGRCMYCVHTPKYLKKHITYPYRAKVESHGILLCYYTITYIKGAIGKEV